MKGWSGKRESEMASNQTSGIQGTGVTREETSRSEASRIAWSRFGATRTDYNDAAPRWGTRAFGRCRIFRRESLEEVCIGGGWTWDAALADADAFHRGVRS